MAQQAKTLPQLADFGKMVWRRFDEDRCLPIASSLTFTTLLAIVPIITVTLTLIAAFPVFGELTEQLETFIMDNLLPESAEAIATYTQQFTANAARLTAVGIFFLFVTAMIVLMTIDRALNEIWRVPRPRPPVQRVFIYWALLTVGPILIGASLSLTSWLVSIPLGLVGDVPYVAKVMLRLVAIGLTGCAFAMLYITLPNRRVQIRDAFAGGFLAAVAFELMKHGFALYVTQFPTYKLVYGAFASVPIFLMWVYLSWLVVLFGAVAAAVLPEWRERESQVEAVPGAQFYDALQILRLLWEAHHTGDAVGERQLHAEVKLPIHRIEALLAAMSAEHWVGRVAHGWAMTRDIHAISVADVYDLFVLRGEARLPARQSGQELDRHAQTLAGGLRGNLQISLEELFQRAGTAAAPRDGPLPAVPEAGVGAAGILPR